MSKDTGDGHVVIVELVSKGRQSLQPMTAWQNTYEAFENIWGKKKEVNSASQDEQTPISRGYQPTSDSGEQANPTSLAPVDDTGAISPPITNTQQGANVEDVSSYTSITTDTQDVKQNFEGAERERGISKNVYTDTAMVQELRESFNQSPEMYTQLSNKETLARAKGIYAKGYEYARSEVERAIGKGKEGYKIAPEIVPLAKMVSNELTRRGEVETARNIMADIALETTAAGQLNQVQRIMRNSDPVTALATVEKLIDEVNAEFQKNNPKSDWRASLTETEKQQILSTDFTEDGAWTDIYESEKAR